MAGIGPVTPVVFENLHGLETVSNLEPVAAVEPVGQIACDREACHFGTVAIGVVSSPSGVDGM